MLGYLKDNAIITSDAMEKLSQKEEKILKEIKTLQTKIEFSISVKNNGKRDTTIVSGRINIIGCSLRNSSDIDMGRLRTKVLANSVIDLPDMAVFSNDLTYIPQPVMFKICMETLLDKFKSWNMWSDISSSVSLDYFNCLAKDMKLKGWSTTPLEIEVEVTDQFGNKAIGQTILMDPLKELILSKKE